MRASQSDASRLIYTINLKPEPLVEIAGLGAGAILADPPLAFQTRSPKGEGRTPQHHYLCLTFEELAALPVASIAAADAFLFLWVPLRSVFVMRPLMEAWGFAFSGSAFAWVKLNKKSPGWFMGSGYGTRHNIEICWLGRRGAPQRQIQGCARAHRRARARAQPQT